MNSKPDDLAWRGLAIACAIALPLWAIVAGVIGMATGWRP